jgi:hypothetical protein
MNARANSEVGGRGKVARGIKSVKTGTAVCAHPTESEQATSWTETDKTFRSGFFVQQVKFLLFTAHL